MLDWIRVEEPDLVGFGLTGRITREDLREVLPQVERAILESGKARVLVEFREVTGIEPKALWEELMFDAGHFKDIGRLAVIGDSRREKWLTSAATPFASEQARFFDPGEKESAWIWVRQTIQPSLDKTIHQRRMKMAEPMTEKSESGKGVEKVREAVRRIDQSMPEGREGSLTMRLEKGTSRIPSLAFLGLAVASMAGSAAAEFFGERRYMKSPRGRNLGTFIGLWAPTFLLLGIYNKLVKVEGSERHEKEGFGGYTGAGVGSSRSYY